MGASEAISDKITCRLLEDGIIEVRLDDNCHLEMDDLIMLKRRNMELAGGKEYGVLFLSGSFTTYAVGVREKAASPEFSVNNKATAIIISNVGQRILGNFYIKVNKPVVKTKMFTDRQKALVWLRGQLRIS